jgi:hypothetical protein
MRTYIIKVIIAFVATYALFEISIAPRIDFYSSKINYMNDHQKRIELKEKILLEIEKGTKKDNYLDADERLIISNFIKKIIKELDIEK